MLRMLKILCILLNVLMLMRSAIAFSKDLEDHEASDISFFKMIHELDYTISNMQYTNNYNLSGQNCDSVTMINESVSPKDTPSEPTFPRAFVEFGDILNKKDIFVTFRWNEPEFTNGVIQNYRVQYWFDENLNPSCVNIIPNTILQHKVYDLKPDTMYYFKVQAHNKYGAGPYTKFNVSTTHENPVPLLLVKSLIGMHVLDIDLQVSFEYNNDTYEEIAYSVLEHKIYGITNKTFELRTWDFNSSAIETKPNFTKIADLNAPTRNLCIDWVARNLYWLQQEDNNQTNNIMKLDLTLWQMGIVKYNNILKINGFKCLSVLPSIRYFYWIGLTSDQQYMIMQSDLNGKNMKPLLENNKCFCPYKLLESDSFMQIDNTNIDKPLIYWTSKNRLFAADIHECMCKLIFSAGNNQTRFNYLTTDKTNIYLYSKNKSLFYILKKKYANFESKENATERVQKVHSSIHKIYQIIAFNKFLQPYPPTICLTPNMTDYRVEGVSITANSIIVNLPEPIPKDECEKYNLATTIYNISVSYLTCLNNDLSKSDEFYVQAYERHYEIQNLMPLTKYTIKLALSNFYFDKLSKRLQFGKGVTLKTTAGKLNAPEDVTVQVLTPTLAKVYWMPPKNLNCVAVNYEVHWILISNILLPNGTRKITPQQEEQFINQIEHTDGKFFTTIRSLKPGQKYLIYVRVYPTNFSKLFTDSLRKIFYMSEPNNLSLSGASTNGMNISWIPSDNLENYSLEYKNDTMPEWQKAIDVEMIDDKATYYIKNLMPLTLYNFRLILRYTEYKEDFIWPPYGNFTFSTIGSIEIVRSEIPAMQYYKPLIVSFFVNFVIYACYFYYSYRRRKESNKLVPKVEYDPELRHLLDEFALTFEKRQITLGEFLGSGAFGEVYQGTVKDFEGSETTPVAIKMLKNTSSQEKIKFLKEANRMSDFRHKHVLRLLGICVDTDSPWLILELMEAGDLLQYLRESRALRPSDSQALRLQDLLAMCEDVARGCRYLEEQRFVHRDLACRNCLISGRNRKNRIVKIGDFGLARDIYTNDYYRMEGKTLLPVRWMAPEALKYQYFTSKSDVWAFGVLMWEITSLGLTPYYARNDIEVCIYVGAGGMLSKPLNCPSTLYQLMLSCWNAANERPKFKLCLENIISLRDNIEDTILSSVDIIKRVQLPPSKIPEYLKILKDPSLENLVESTANRISEHLTANDASNDVIESLT